MGRGSSIEWTHHTFNPWWGCTKLSDGCAHCYASGQARRWGYDVWGPGKPRRELSKAYWRKPLRWNAEAQAGGEAQRVFCGSMCDVFEEREDRDPLRHRLWELIKATPDLDWLLLTKRPTALVAWAREHGWPLNAWAGTSIESQDVAWRAVELLKLPAFGRHLFLSCEPLLGPLDLTKIRGEFTQEHIRGSRFTLAHPVSGVFNVLSGTFTPDDMEELRAAIRPELPEAAFSGWEWATHAIDQVIVGGESDGGRPFDLAWARSLRDQCEESWAWCFMKQMGSNPIEDGRPLKLKSRKGNDMSEWPEDLRLREAP